MAEINIRYQKVRATAMCVACKEVTATAMHASITIGKTIVLNYFICEKCAKREGITKGDK